RALRAWSWALRSLSALFRWLGGSASFVKTAGRGAAPAWSNGFSSRAGPPEMAVGGLVLWGVHARVIAIKHISEDRHSTLRALEGFIVVAFCIGSALYGATQILYYALARGLGVSNPGNAGTNLMAELANPGSLLLVYGIAWVLIRRRLARDAGTQEADRQAAIRRLYTNLASLISLAAWAYGAFGLLATLAKLAEAPIIGVAAPDWKDPLSLSVTLLIVGAA